MLLFGGQNQLLKNENCIFKKKQNLNAAFNSTEETVFQTQMQDDFFVCLFLLVCLFDCFLQVSRPRCVFFFLIHKVWNTEKSCNGKRRYNSSVKKEIRPK